MHPLISDYAASLREIAAATQDEREIIARVGPLAREVALDQGWIEERFFDPDRETGFSAFLLHEEDDHSLAVLAASWVPGMGVGPHDHGTWAVVAGVRGIEQNTRYRRLDDRRNPNHAELEVKEVSEAGPGDLVCIRSGGIHSVLNTSDEVTVSLHTYGWHINHTERFGYDLENNTASEFKVNVE